MRVTLDAGKEAAQSPRSCAAFSTASPGEERGEGEATSCVREAVVPPALELDGRPLRQTIGDELVPTDRVQGFGRGRLAASHDAFATCYNV